jgi:hypothetical protein
MSKYCFSWPSDAVEINCLFFNYLKPIGSMQEEFEGVRQGVIGLPLLEWMNELPGDWNNKQINKAYTLFEEVQVLTAYVTVALLFINFPNHLNENNTLR